MRFRIEQDFATDPVTLCAALVDPRYLTEAMGRLPDIAAPIVVSQDRDDGKGTVRQLLQYAFNGRLPSAVTHFISPDRLTWIEDSTINMASQTAVFRITPVHYKHFFTCSGTWTIDPRPGGCARILDGSLTVNSPVPFVGGKVEKAIVSGLRERLDKEPAAFEWWRETFGKSV